EHGLHRCGKSSGGFPMTVLRSQLPRKACVSVELHQALQLLANSPRGTTEDVLELGHGFSRETLAMLTLDGLVMVVTETLRANDATCKIERIQITDAGRQAFRRSANDSRLNADRVPSTGRNAAAAAGGG